MVTEPMTAILVDLVNVLFVYISYVSGQTAQVTEPIPMHKMAILVDLENAFLVHILYISDEIG